jgi:hypothetical protein
MTPTGECRSDHVFGGERDRVVKDDLAFAPTAEVFFYSCVPAVRRIEGREKTLPGAA